MKRKKWVTGVAAAVLIAMLLAGYLAVAAELGSKNDPLVTLGYITDELQPYIMSEVEDAIDSKTQEFSDQINEETEKFQKQMDEKIASIGTGATGVTDEAFIDSVADAVLAKMEGQTQGTGVSSGYKKIQLASGKTVTGKIGTEILLRLGSAQCVSSGDVGLVDLTDATTLSSGKTLAPNHLYIVTIDGRGFKATSAATLFIRGDYSTN